MKNIKLKTLQTTLGAVTLAAGALMTAGTAQAALVDLTQSQVNGNVVTPISNLADTGELKFDIDHNNFNQVNLQIEVTAEEVAGGTLDLGSLLRNLTPAPWPGYTLELGGTAATFFSDVSGTLDPPGTVTLSSDSRIADIVFDSPINNDPIGDPFNSEVFLGEVDASFGDLPWVIDISHLGNDDLAFRLKMQPVPVPAAVWLFGSALLGLIGVARRRQEA